MRYLMITAFASLAIGVVIGCKREEKPGPTETEAAEAKCPGCGAAMQAGAFCAKCKAIASTGKTVRCEKCQKDFKEGQYCAKCNAFMFDEMTECAGCGAKAKKGAFCEKCKAYVGLPKLGYCENCKVPVPKDTGCPVCKAKGAAGA